MLLVLRAGIKTGVNFKERNNSIQTDYEKD